MVLEDPFLFDLFSKFCKTKNTSSVRAVNKDTTGNTLTNRIKFNIFFPHGLSSADQQHGEKYKMFKRFAHHLNILACNLVVIGVRVYLMNIGKSS